MRRPLENLLAEAPDLGEAKSLSDAEERLRSVFAAAQAEANAYSAERLQELYEVAERALALSAAFPPPPSHGAAQPAAEGPWWKRLPQLAGRYGAGILLAACAPLVADSSVTLAILAGVAAALSLTAGRRPGLGAMVRRKVVEPRAVEAKLRSLLSAADRSLTSMTAPRALQSPSGGRGLFQEEDVLNLLQEVMALGREVENEAAQAMAENAERLAARAGFEPLWTPHPDMFEVMRDPAVPEPLLLKPALVHKSDPTRTVFGLLVRS